MRRWLARRLRRFVDRHDPITIVPNAATIPVGGDLFCVHRVVDGREWDLYRGEDAQEACRLWEMVRKNRERGAMRYWHNGVLRDVYQGD